MAIINFNPNNNQVHKTGQNQPATTKPDSERSANTSDARPTSTDSIDLTESAKLIQHLDEQLKKLPVVDSERVSHVRENLNSGNYQISSQSIANKFTQYESFLQKAI